MTTWTIYKTSPEWRPTNHLPTASTMTSKARRNTVKVNKLLVFKVAPHFNQLPIAILHLQLENWAAKLELFALFHVAQKQSGNSWEILQSRQFGKGQIIFQPGIARMSGLWYDHHNPGSGTLQDLSSVNFPSLWGLAQTSQSPSYHSAFSSNVTSSDGLSTNIATPSATLSSITRFYFFHGPYLILLFTLLSDYPTTKDRTENPNRGAWRIASQNS